jgi:hypothetical protein
LTITIPAFRLIGKAFALYQIKRSKYFADKDKYEDQQQNAL